jgi:hypothetical protein
MKKLDSQEWSLTHNRLFCTINKGNVQKLMTYKNCSSYFQ